MSIDWFTFGAQIVNFLILVGLLRYFLYQPISRAMNDRETKVTRRLTDAEAAKAEAVQQRKQLREEAAQLEARRDRWITQAKEEVETQRKELISQARGEAESRHQQWTAAFERDQHDAAQRTAREIQRLGFQAADRTLEQIAGNGLQHQIVSSFIEQLHTLDEKQRDAIAMQLADSGNDVLIRAAKKLETEEQSRLQQALREAFVFEAGIRFENDPTLIAGLEVDAGGYSLSWNAAAVLNEMKTEIKKQPSWPDSTRIRL